MKPPLSNRRRLNRNLHDSGGSPPRAAVTVGHSILVIAYHLLDRHVAYQDLGGDYFVSRTSEQAHIRRLVAQLERLGQKVTLEPSEIPAA